jgi:predicted dehydrogenase
VQYGVKAVFCEKPIADSLTAADEMIRLCAEQNVLLMIDQQRRFDPFHQKIAKFIKNGKLGRIQQVTCYYTAGVANTGSHLFDLLRFYLGEVIWVQGRYSKNTSPNPHDPNIDAWLCCSDGTLVAIQACDVRTYLIFEVSLLGTEGRLRITSSGFNVEFEEVRASERFAGYKELFLASSPISPKGTHEFMLFGVFHLLECLKSGQKPICSGEDGRAVLEIICALHESAKAGGKLIELPLSYSSIIIKSR